MIVVDPLFDTTPFTRAGTPRCFRNTMASHMMTTLEGEAGLRELIDFAKRLGLRPEWVQYPGTRRQHFDLVQAKRARALKMGAIEVPSRWMSGDPVPGAVHFSCDPEAGECGGCDAHSFRLWGCPCGACHGANAYATTIDPDGSRP